LSTRLVHKLVGTRAAVGFAIATLTLVGLSGCNEWEGGAVTVQAGAKAYPIEGGTTGCASLPKTIEAKPDKQYTPVDNANTHYTHPTRLRFSLSDLGIKAGKLKFPCNGTEDKLWIDWGKTNAHT